MDELIQFLFIQGCLYEHGNQPFWTLSIDDVTLPNLNCLTEGGFEFSFPIE